MKQEECMCLIAPFVCEFVSTSTSLQTIVYSCVTICSTQMLNLLKLCSLLAWLVASKLPLLLLTCCRACGFLLVVVGRMFVLLFVFAGSNNALCGLVGLNVCMRRFLSTYAYLCGSEFFCRARLVKHQDCQQWVTG